MKHLNRTSKLIPLLLCLALLLPAAAARAQDAPFNGVVTRNTVEIRSGAGLAFYEVGQLDKNQVVKVEEVLFNNTWYKIQVPPGIYSYISKAFVDAQGDGTTGVINSNETEVLAASLRGPGVSYRVQTLLGRGTQVKIVEEEGSYYKVAPPAGAYVFIPAGTLRVATAADMVPAPEQPEAEEPTEQPEAEEPAETPAEPTEQTPDQTPTETPDQTPAEQPGEGERPMPQPGNGDTDPTPPIETPEEPEGETPDPVDTPDPVETPEEPVEGEQPEPGPEAPPQGGLPPAPDVVVQTQARSEALIAAELELLPYFHLPLEERPLDELERRYTKVAAENELGKVDQQIVEIRLRGIQSQRRALAAILRSREARETQQPPAREPAQAELPEAPADYSEVGILGISTQYDGGDLPQLYRLISPSGRTIAYIEPGDHINTATMLDKLVGVVGPRRYDPALKLHIIRVERADVLTSRAEDE